jgi:hypothetical protein
MYAITFKYYLSNDKKTGGTKMEKLGQVFFDFLIEAKKHTYAAGGESTGSCRRASKDLGYSSGEYEYLDSYFGTSDFIGGEVVYKAGIPIWGMNYYGISIDDVDSPSGDEPSLDMGVMLHAALMEPPLEAPYRGPRYMKKGDCEYQCSWKGRPDMFWGKEEILREGKRIYFLRFHGGALA